MISGRKLHSLYADISRHLVRQTPIFFQPKRTKSLSLQQTEYHCEILKNRSLIKLAGSETLPFLQGLVTNDVRHLVDNHQTSVTLPCLYSAFLNQQGRVLYDTILYNISNSSDSPTFLVECDSSICDELITHLKIYRIRKKIEIVPMVDKLIVWSLFTLIDAEKQSLKERQEVLLKHVEEKVSPVILTKDPRCTDLGFRCIVPADFSLSDVLQLTQKNETAISDYTQLRYKVGIGEGVCDHPPEKCFPLECNMDFLHGVSFYKGCYVGQELTARTYHTGVVRKRLMPIKFVNEPIAKVVPETIILNENGTNVGKFRSHQGRCGLALLRVEESLASRHFIVKGTDIELSTKKPSWWPQESVKSG